MTGGNHDVTMMMLMEDGIGGDIEVGVAAGIGGAKDHRGDETSEAMVIARRGMVREATTEDAAVIVTIGKRMVNGRRDIIDANEVVVAASIDTSQEGRIRNDIVQDHATDNGVKAHHRTADKGARRRMSSPSFGGFPFVTSLVFTHLFIFYSPIRELR